MSHPEKRPERQAAVVSVHQACDDETNGLPWPALTHDDERLILALIHAGDIPAAAERVSLNVNTAHANLARARRAMGGVTTLAACLAYQRFRLTGSLS